MKSRRKAVGWVGLSLILVACQQPPPPDYSDNAELKRIEHVARDILQLKLDKIVRSGTEANYLGIKSENILFSQRLDSRTYFVQDQRYGVARESGVFAGSDQELIQSGRDVLRRLDIPLSEVGEEAIVREFLQAAQIDSAKRLVRLEEPQKGQRFVRFSRAIEGLPVFSSRLLLGLTKGKEIGFMELHWPEIPKHVVTEAHRLEYKLQHDWRPPEKEGAIVESMRAGIFHSSAVGFLMDAYPTIRVIYAPADTSAGKKPVYYFDRYGKAIPLPRQFDLPPQAPRERK